MNGTATWPKERMIWVFIAVLLAVGVLGLVLQNEEFSQRFTRLEEAMRRIETGKSQTTSTVDVVPVTPSETIGTGLPSVLSDAGQRLIVPLVKKDGKAGEWLQDSQRLGTATPLTADGWFVVSSDAIGSVKVADLALVWEGRLLSVDRGVKDTVLGVTFLKATVQNASVVAFAPVDTMLLGAPMWVLEKDQLFTTGAFQRFAPLKAGEVRSSDRDLRTFAVPSSKVAQSAWDERGRLIGLATHATSTTLLPSSRIRLAFDRLLDSGEIRYPTLGAHFIELSSAMNQDARSLPARGALLRGDQKTKRVAVIPNGPAANKLREGDVIERIERDVLDGGFTLADRILEYRPGSDVRISGTRDGKPFETQVKLGSFLASEALK